MISVVDATSRCEPLGHQILGRRQRRKAARLGAIEHGSRRGSDLTDSLHRTAWVVTMGFFGDIDDATGVRQKVRDIEDAGRRK